MSAEVEVTKLVELLDKLHENLDLVDNVLEDTYGTAVAREVAVAQKANRPIEDALSLIAERTSGAIDRVQSIRERLQGIMRRL